MTMEAIAGKNPISHVGKIYNVLAERMAREIVELQGIEEAYVTLVSKIGSPIRQPLLKGVRICGDVRLTDELEKEVSSIIESHLESTDRLAEDFVRGGLTLY
jgi:S-adenosylmethionine synthetase